MMFDFFGTKNQVPDATKEPSWVELGKIRRKDAVAHWEPHWKRAEGNWQLYYGKLYTPNEKTRAREKSKALLEFNDYPTILNSATGKERVNRFRAALKARDRGGEKDPGLLQELFEKFGIDESIDDPKVAGAMTEHLRKIEQGCHADSEWSDALLDAFVGGFGHVETAIDAMDGISGKVKTQELLQWQVAWDPNSTKAGMRDADHVFSFIWISLDVAEALFPDYYEDIVTQSTVKANWLSPKVDQKNSPRMEYELGSIGTRFFNPQNRQVLLTHYECKVREDRWLFIDPETGSKRDVEVKEWRRLLKRWREGGIEKPDFEKIPQWAYKQAWFAGDVALQKELEPNAIDGFTIETVTCFPSKSREGTTWFGPGDLGRDPARWKGKFMSLMVDILAAGPKGALLGEEGAFKDVEDARKQLPRSDGLVVLRQGGKDKIQFAPQPAYPSALMPLTELAAGGIWSTMGLSQTSAGMLDDPRRAPFQTVNAIMQANQSVFAMPFDSLSTARKNVARKYLLYTRDYIDPVDVLRTVGIDHIVGVESLMQQVATDEDDSPLQTPYWDWDREKFDKMLEYDVVTDDVPASPSQMIAVFQVLTQTDMFSVLQQAGVAPPIDVIIDSFVHMGLPSTLGDKWREEIAGVITPEQQGAALQQLIGQLSPELQQAIEAELTQGQPAEGTPVQ